MDQLSGKVAVITGGASGIGLATAKLLASRGMRIALADIEADSLALAVAEIRDRGAEAIGVVTDVSDYDSVAKLRDQVLEAWGAVFFLFNNAGVGGGSLIESPPKVWEWVLGVNTFGVAWGIHAFLPTMLAADEGHIINTASLAGLGGVPGMGPYSASKFAVVGTSESLLYELDQRGSNVTCSVLCPGFVRTRIHEAERNLPDDVAASMDLDAYKAGQSITEDIIEAGLDVDVVANAVVEALDDRRFWILTHERAALGMTKRRLAWMEGGDAPGTNLERATR